MKELSDEAGGILKCYLAGAEGLRGKKSKLAMRHSPLYFISTSEKRRDSGLGSSTIALVVAGLVAGRVVAGRNRTITCVAAICMPSPVVSNLYTLLPLIPSMCPRYCSDDFR